MNRKESFVPTPLHPTKGEETPVGSEFNNDTLSWAHLLPFRVKKLQSTLAFGNLFFSESFFAVMYRLCLGFNVSR